MNTKQAVYKLLNQNGNQDLGSIEDSTKIFLLISFIFCILFLLLRWKKEQCKSYFKRIFIWLFLFLIVVLYYTTSRSQWLLMTNKSYLNRQQ
jgi:phosphoglycerol transferase MdoB-like AlkP superfamily enzyme